MLKSVKLYGELAEKYGKEWSLDIENPAEAIRALDVNNPGFRQFVGSSEQRGVGYKVMVGKSYIKDYSELADPSGKQEIKIVPVVLGAKKSGIAMVLLGALLIWNPMGWGAMSNMGAMTAETAALSTTTLGGVTVTNTYAMMVKFGGALILGGIASMLAPTPKPVETKESVQNYAFNGAANTTRQGVCIPVCYGQLIVGGAVISSGVEPEDYTP